MKRAAFIKYLEQNDCYLYREGANHPIYRNKYTGEQATVPRHQEIKNLLCRKICIQLQVPVIR